MISKLDVKLRKTIIIVLMIDLFLCPFFNIFKTMNNINAVINIKNTSNLLKAENKELVDKFDTSVGAEKKDVLDGNKVLAKIKDIKSGTVASVTTFTLKDGNIIPGKAVNDKVDGCDGLEVLVNSDNVDKVVAELDSFHLVYDSVTANKADKQVLFRVLVRGFHN